jgi:hypothetical protein
VRAIRFLPRDLHVANRIFEDITVDVGFVDPMYRTPSLGTVMGRPEFTEVGGILVPTAAMEQQRADSTPSRHRRTLLFSLMRLAVNAFSLHKPR